MNPTDIERIRDLMDELPYGTNEPWDSVSWEHVQKLQEPQSLVMINLKEFIEGIYETGYKDGQKDSDRLWTDATMRIIQETAAECGNPIFLDGEKIYKWT